MYEEVIELISKNLNGRKIAFRYKDDLFESELERFGLEVDIRISTNLNLIKKGVTPESALYNKSKEYLIVICPSWPWNENDSNRYSNAGYVEGRDVIWCSKNHVLTPKLHDVVTDNHNNSVECHSEQALKTKFVFKGKNSHIHIERNTILPERIVVANDGNLRVGENCKIYSNLVHLSHGATISIGDNCTIPHGVELLGDPHSTITIGNSCTMGINTKIRPGINGIITIGNDCMFSWDVILIGHDEHLLYDLETKECLNNSAGEKKEYIRLEDHVWLGGETVVLAGTHIHTGCMAGYRSLIKGEVPNNTMVVGSPARVIKKNIAWVRQNIDRDGNLLEMLDERYRCMTENI